MLTVNQPIQVTNLPARFKSANQRLIILDYDGVLVPHVLHPGLTNPSKEIITVIQSLAGDDANKIILFTNRDTEHLEKYWADTNAILVAENGAMFKESEGEWRSVFSSDNSWIAKVAPAINALSFQFEGTFVEKMTRSVTWHFGAANHKLAEGDIRQVTAAIRALPQFGQFTIYHGPDFLELSTPGIDAGSFVARWIGGRHFDFILAIGGERMDEALFGLFTNGATLVRVAPNGWTNGNYRLDRQEEVLPLLASLCATQATE